VKIVRVIKLIERGPFSSSKEWNDILGDITQSITRMEWPPSSGSFTLKDESGKKRGKGSGVKPIRDAFCRNLKALGRGWDFETRLEIAARAEPGPIDATIRVGDKLFAVEWETGNISSSHRALNKMAIGILRGMLVGGCLILPTLDMSKYLTDRVGRLEEIEPYFPLWAGLPTPEGVLAVVAVEHDALSQNVPRIPKGTNGRAVV
jgi:hypothetical protein